MIVCYLLSCFSRTRWLNMPEIKFMSCIITEFKNWKGSWVFQANVLILYVHEVRTKRFPQISSFLHLKLDRRLACWSFTFYRLVPLIEDWA